jgi:class 3 adenylate cyclase
VGSVKLSINPNTGRMCYFGKVMNRSARISSLAKSGQVLCSAEAFLKAQTRSVPMMSHDMPVIGSTLGHHVLKGLPNSIEIIRCTLAE